MQILCWDCKPTMRGQSELLLVEIMWERPSRRPVPGTEPIWLGHMTEPHWSFVRTFKIWWAVWLSVCLKASLLHKFHCFLHLPLALLTWLPLSLVSLCPPPEGVRFRTPRVWTNNLLCWNRDTLQTSWFSELAWGATRVHCGREKPWRGQNREGEGAVVPASEAAG